MDEELTFTAFLAEKRIASGRLKDVRPQLKAALGREEQTPLVLIFEDQTGRQVDFDLRGAEDEVMARVAPLARKTGPGRPKLGVISREISLLPRHWEWLEQQSGGASAALRRLVDEGRKREPGRQRARLAMDAANRFMTAMAGNLPGYEEATRALYAARRAPFESLIEEWPHDIRAHAKRLAEDAFYQEIANPTDLPLQRGAAAVQSLTEQP